MFYLDKLKDNYIYQKKQITAFKKSKNIKNIKQNQLVLHVGTNENDIINLINSNFFKKENFLSFFVPRLMVSLNKRKKSFIVQNGFYKNFATKVNYKMKYRLKESQYSKLNLFIDLTSLIQLNESSFKGTLITRTENFFKVLAAELKKHTYTNTLILINIDNVNSDEKMNPYRYLEYAIKYKKFIADLTPNITFIVYTTTNNSFIKILSSQELYDKKSLVLQRLKNLLDIKDNIIKGNIDTSDETQVDAKKDNVIKVNVKASNIVNKIKNDLDIVDKEMSDDVEKEVDTLTDIVTQKVENSPDDTEEEIMNQLDNDNEAKTTVKVITDMKKGGRPKVNEEVLKKKQDEVVFDNIKLSDIINNYDNTKIEKTEINKDKVTNSEINVCSVRDFDKSYADKQFSKDMASVLKSFNDDPDIKMFVKKVSLEESSDDLTKKSTMNIEFSDEYNVTHKVKMDIPKITDGKFMYVNGSKKIIMKQIMLKPIVKTKSNEVQIVSNYNKLFVSRFGQTKSEKIAVFKDIFNVKDFKKYILPDATIKYRLGNSVSINNKYVTNVEYNEISSFLLELQMNNTTILFNQEILNKKFDPFEKEYNKTLASIKFDKTLFFPIGYINGGKSLLAINYMDQFVYEITDKESINFNTTLTNYLLKIRDFLDVSINNVVNFSARTNKSLSYTRVEINNKKVPVIVLLAYELGFKEVLKRYGIKYEFSEKNKVFKVTDNIARIKFSNGYLFYDTSRIKNTLLISGINCLDTVNMEFDDLDIKETYTDFFYDSWNSRNIGKGFHNTLTMMVDPITKEVLEDLKLPTNIYDILLYANTLLEDLHHTPLNDMSLYRIRCEEQVPAMMYKILADSYKTYKDMSNAKNPKPISIPQDALVKKLLELKTVDEYNELNPILELERINAATYKGLGGMNNDDSFTTEIRGYSKSMVGVLSQTGPESDKVGVVRSLSYNSSINSTRGYIDLDKNKNGNSDLYDPSELMSPFTCSHADPPRQGMQNIQSKHVISTVEQDPPLVGSGIEKVMPYLISDDFAFKAKKDGFVESIDEKTGLITIAYKDGTKECFDTSNKMSKNGGGGFYVCQNFDILYKVNEKFKSGDIIAKNSRFFSGTKKTDDIMYTPGKLAKVAITSGDFTFEDSSVITEEVSNQMASLITMKQDCVLGVASNISYIVKEGQKIRVGEPLIVFEDFGADSDIGGVLDKLKLDDDEYKDKIQELSRNTKLSHYDGKVVKINMYYNKDVEEFSPSIQKVLKEYIDYNNDKRKIMEKINGSSDVNMPIVNKQTTNKIKGIDVDGIMIEFYIEYKDSLSIGDKMAFYTSLKSVISNVIPKGQEPYSDFDPTENIGAIISPLSIVSRMVNDEYLSMYSNKTLIELKKKVKKLFDS